jgi:hypothetical protein
VVPITTADYPTPARRPAASVLDCTRFERTFAIPRRQWTEQLDAVLQSLLGAHPPAVRMESAIALGILERACKPATNPTPSSHKRHRKRAARA